MKQLDKLMARSFIGPFIVTFAIALFVLLMQILWVYLDDIAGKGLSFFQVIELIGYKCVGLIPLALPLSLLISSVMVLGALAEHYELSSFKSAGVGLFRIMAVMILFGIIGSGISFACSDYVIPAANVQFGARMYDIKQKKPTLNLEAGTFNEDFSEYVIRIGSKNDDGERVKDIHVYDHSKTNVGQMSQIIAETGRMYTEGEGDLFVMHLQNGHQYAETSPRGSKKKTRQLTYVRTAFEEWTKIFDLSQFDLKRTSRNLFNQNRAMLATWQLQNAVDSIDLDIMERKQILSNHLINYLPRLTRDTIKYRVSDVKLDEQPGTTRIDAGKPATGEKDDDKAKTNKRKRPERQDPKLGKKARRNAYKHELVVGFKEDKGVEALFSGLAKNEKTRVINRARTGVRAILSQAESSNRILPSIAETRVKHVYDLHMKYSMALVCIIFIFIGAPMGAIVRKGGFGYPILVSVIFFVIFIILTIFCRKLAESFVLTGELAGWMPCIVLFPVGIFLTVMAMNDRKLGSFEFFGKFRDWLVNLSAKSKADAPLDEDDAITS